MITMTRILVVHVLVKLTLPSRLNLGVENIKDFGNEYDELLDSTLQTRHLYFLKEVVGSNLPLHI